MRESFRIVTNPILRDERIERRIIEKNREDLLLKLLLAGAVLILVAVIY
jgi:hypothetical protein